MVKLKYAPTHCEQTGREQGDYRFYIEQMGDKMLFVVGLNPSTADDKIADKTMGRVLEFVEKAGYNGFVMLNLSARRQTDKHQLPTQQDDTQHQKALAFIRKLGDKYPTADVLLAFGNDIILRPYLKSNLIDIVNVLGKREFFQIGELTTKGYPRHPLYASSSLTLKSYNTEKLKK